MSAHIVGHSSTCGRTRSATLACTVIVASLVATSGARAGLSFNRTDYPVAPAPPSNISGNDADQPVALVDLNKDGRLDIVMSDFGTGAVHALLNQGGGTFAAAAGSPFPACPSHLQAEGIVAGQFNPATDQNPDVIVACAFEGNVVRLLGDGQGHLGSPEAFLSGAISALTFAHLSGAPDGDLVYSKVFGGAAACFFPVAALGDGSTTEVCGAGGGHLARVHFYDGPCASDELLSFDASAFPVFQLEVIGVGNACAAPFATSLRDSGIVNPSNPSAIVGADLDGDGDPDVVMADTSGGLHVQAWTAAGIAQDAQPANFSSVLPIRSLAVADFDGDGHADIAVAEDDPSLAGPNVVAIHLGHGTTSQFDAAMTFPVTGDQSTYTDLPKMAVGDLDGDGKPDIVVVAGYAGSVSVLLNAGSGASTTSTTTTTLPPGGCTSILTCLAALDAELPSPTSATSKKLKRAASALQKRYTTLRKTLTHAASSTGKKRVKQYAKAHAQLEALLGAAQKAATKGTLGVPLVPIQDAGDALLGQLP